MARDQEEGARVNSSRRWRPVAVGLVVVAAALAAWRGYWWLASERLRTATLAQIDQARARGYAVNHAGVRRDGFPTRARIVLAEPAISAPGAAPDWRWAGAEAAVSVALAAPWAPEISTRGRQTITVRDAGRERTWTGAVGALGYTAAAGGWLPAGRLVLTDLTLAEAATGDRLGLGALEAIAAGDPARAADLAAVSWRLRVQASEIVPPAALALPLAPGLEHAECELQVKGALAPAPWPAAVEAWRDAGGSVELAAVAVRYGPLTATGDGTLALDRTLQPEGAMRLEVRGLPAALDALAARGLVDPRLAGTLAGVLASAAAADAVPLPLTLQDRMLSVGPLPVARLPALVWVRSRRLPNDAGPARTVP